jgi:hypothetical protein
MNYSTGSGTYSWSFGLARDDRYVYGFSINVIYSDDYLVAREPTGSLVRVVHMPGIGGYWQSFADNSHLGTAYLAVCDDGELLTVEKTTGSVVSRFYVRRQQAFFWDGSYYVFARYQSPGVFDRFTSSGGAAGTWTAAGWPAAITSLGGCGYSPYACDAEGDYLVASSNDSREPSCIIDLATGSLVATWAFGYCEGAVCGAAYPGTYGDTYWVLKLRGSSFYAFQIDIDGRHIGVAPASVGKIKALYR